MPSATEAFVWTCGIFAGIALLILGWFWLSVIPWPTWLLPTVAVCLVFGGVWYALYIGAWH